VPLKLSAVLPPIVVSVGWLLPTLDEKFRPFPLLSEMRLTPVSIVIDDESVGSSHKARPLMLRGLKPVALGRSSLGDIGIGMTLL